jgi:hypothetical protein
MTKITSGLQQLGFKLMDLGFSKLGLSIADTVPINDQNNDTREGVLDIAARCFAREVMNDLTSRMIGAARTSGRDSRPGKLLPAFVQDWRKFILGGQNRGEDIFRAIVSSTGFCPQYSNEIKSIYGALYNQPSIKDIPIRVNNLDAFTSRARCTLPQGWSLQNFTNDFTGNGGWEALLRLSQPQNNYFGSLLNSEEELSNQRAQGQNEDVTEAITGGSFTGRRGKPGETCLVMGQKSCLIYNDILTPGKTIEATAANAIQSELTWVGNVDEWQELITYAMQTVMSRVLDLSKAGPYDQELYDATNEPIPSPYDGDNLTGNPTDWTSPLPAPITACSDGVDNDGDGLIDLGDPDCTSASDTDESGGTSGTCTQPLTDPHPDRTDAVIQAKNQLLSQGMVFDPNASNFECNRFEIVKLAATLIGGTGNNAAGVYSKTSGTNCGGYATDIIAFPDGYIYDVLSGGAADGAGPAWQLAACLPLDPSRYRTVPAGGTTSQVTLCSNSNFGGTCETFSSSDPYLGDRDNSGGIPNNSASSIRVPAGTTVWLCSGEFFQGNCPSFTGDDSDLTDNGINDDVSSIRFAAPETNPSCGALIQIPDPNSAYCGTSTSPGSGWISAGTTYDCQTCWYNPYYQTTNQPPSGPVCGDSICDIAGGEDSLNCSADCGPPAP